MARMPDPVYLLKEPLLSTRMFAVHDISYYVHAQMILPGPGYRVWITRVHTWSAGNAGAPLFEEFCPDHEAVQRLLDQIAADPSTFMMEGAL